MSDKEAKIKAEVQKIVDTYKDKIYIKNLRTPA